MVIHQAYRGLLRGGEGGGSGQCWGLRKKLTCKVALENPLRLISNGRFTIGELDRLCYVSGGQNMWQVNSDVFTVQRQVVQVLEHSLDIVVRLAGFHKKLSHVLGLL